MKRNLKFRIYFACCFFLAGLTRVSAQSPTLQWAKSMGGTAGEYGVSIAVDASGNVYTSGGFNGGTDFDPGPGTYTLIGSGSFISKVDAAGNFLWARAITLPFAIGGVNSLKVDGSGNVYTVGEFAGTCDFDPGQGVFNLTSVGAQDIFISKLDASGNFVWAKSFTGTSSTDYGNAIAVDGSGNVYTTGYFDGTVDFDPGAGINNLTSSSSEDMFVSKLDASGNFSWAKITGQYGRSNSIALDLSGNVITTGNFQGVVDFDPGATTYTLAASFMDIFVSKLDGSGNFIWAMKMGGSQQDNSFSIAVDGLANVYTTGYSASLADFDPGPGTYTLTGCCTFISKLDASGNFVWAKKIGGTGNSIAVDLSGNVYTTGYLDYTGDFDPGPGTYTLTAALRDVFILKLDVSGNFSWVTLIGGSLSDAAYSIFVRANGDIYTTGSFESTCDFDPGAGISSLTSIGATDIFVLKLGESPVGLSENTGANNIQLYPNPTTGPVNIALARFFGFTVIKIINPIGQILVEKIFENNTALDLDLSNQPGGIYFVEVKQGENISRIKLVKN